MQATKAAADAVRAEGDVRARAETANAETLDRQAGEAERAVADYKREKAERQADYDETKNQISFMQEQNAKLNQITDRRTTTQKVMGVVAQALSSVGDGLARLGGNTNTDYAGAMTKQLNDQIAMDMQKQREAIEGRNKAVAMKLTELGLAKNALGDVDDAMQFTTAQRQLRFATELKAQAARSNSDIARSQMSAAAAKLEADGAEKLMGLQEKLTEQKYRSRQLGAAKGSGGGALDIASIRATVENGGTLTPAQFKAAKDMGLFKNEESKDVNLTELQGKVARKETLSPQEARVAASAGMLKPPSEKDDTADQAKARMLFASSARPASALEARLKNNKLVGNEASWAEKLGIAPDEWNKQAALQAQEIESVGNDILRYESGASISTQETEGLIARTRSSDPDVAAAAVQRLLDKRAALGQAFKQRPQGNVSGATGAETRATVPASGAETPEYKAKLAAAAANLPAQAIRLSDGKRVTGTQEQIDRAIASGKYKGI
jgi:hypothetical protein